MYLNKVSQTVLLLVIFSLFSKQLICQVRQVYTDPDSSNHVLKINFLSAAEGYVAFSKWIGYSSDSGHTFSKKFITLNNVDYNGYSVAVTLGFEIQGVKAFSSNNLLVYGNYSWVPSILYSSDGGNTFKLVYYSGLQQIWYYSGVADMIFPEDNSTGFAVDDDRILKTTNGGFSWSVLKSEPGSLFNGVQATDNQNVIATSNGYTTNKILKSGNGGLSWVKLNLPSVTNDKFSTVHFLNANLGWLCMNDDNSVNAYLYKTIDGGLSWKLLNDPKGSPFEPDRMKFLDTNTGYAVTGYDLFKTSNGGSLWEPLPKNNSYFFFYVGQPDLQCLNQNQVWYGAGHGYLALSTNGGGAPLPKSYFKVQPGLQLTDTVKLLNYSNPAYQFKWYVNNTLVSTSYNSFYFHNIQSQVDSIMLLTTANGKTDTLKKYQYFTVPNLPFIKSFSPAYGSAGTYITIKGTQLSGVTSVKFGGIQSASFTVFSDTVLKAVVANGASGNITIADVNGSYSLPGFTYFAPSTSAKPVISSVAPWSGNVGTTITISGSNFSPTVENNIVTFGAVKGQVISAGANSLVCKVPPAASYAPISVLNINTGLVATTTRQFSVTFADSGSFNKYSFYSALILPKGNTSPWFIASKDLDGDGKPDLINSNFNFNDSVSLRRNTTLPGSVISFSAPVKIAVFDNFFGIEDLDGDGKPEVVGTMKKNLTGGNASLNVLRNNSTPGQISFAPALNINQDIGKSYIAFADIDNDGKTDLISAYINQTGNSTFRVAVARNTSIPGYISFAKALEFFTPDPIADITTADIDGDGKRDLIAYSSSGSKSTSTVSCFLNQSTPGTISIGPKVDYTVTGWDNKGEIESGDLDGDGKPDIVITCNDSTRIFKNISTAGTISFISAQIMPIRFHTEGAVISNFSGNTLPDLVTGNYGNTFITIYKNRSSPGIVSVEADTILDYRFIQVDLQKPIAADFDLDGKTDIAMYNNRDKSISIFKNYVYADPCVNNIWSGDYANWSDSTRWSCGRVPDANSKVIVPGGRLIVSTDATVYSLKLSPGAILEVRPGVKLTVTH